MAYNGNLELVYSLPETTGKKAGKTKRQHRVLALYEELLQLEFELGHDPTNPKLRRKLTHRRYRLTQFIERTLEWAYLRGVRKLQKEGK